MKTPKSIKRFVLVSIFLVLLFFLNINASETDKQNYQNDLKRINAVKQSFNTDLTNNLEEFEKFADEIQEKWKTKNPEDYAKLMYQICGTLNSGAFESNRGYDAAREYALTALNEPNRIKLDTELELIGFVMTNTGLPRLPKGEELAQRRKKDIEIRLHAWKRLIDAIDPNWDPNDKPSRNVTPPLSTDLPSGIAPEAIRDLKLRAEYELSIEKNRIKSENYLEQSNLRKWLKKYPDRAEKYIVQLYSVPPYNTGELKQLLEKYKIDEQTKGRIIDTINTNIKKAAEEVERLKKLRGQ